MRHTRFAALLLCVASRPHRRPRRLVLGRRRRRPRPATAMRSLFKGAQAIVSVSVLGPESIRVRFSPTREFGRDHSYAVVSRALGSTQAAFDVGAAQSVITTAALKVTIRHDPVPRLLRHRRRRVAGRGRPGAGDRGGGEERADLEAPARRRARLRVRREERPPRQARQQDGRLLLRDVEQRHLRVHGRHRSHLRVGPVLPRAAQRPHPRHLPGQHVAHDLRRGPRVAVPPLLRHRRGGAGLLLPLRAHAAAGGRALHDAHRPHADAPALVARLQPVPLQLLPGVEGPLHRRQLPRAAHPRGRDLARHPLPGRLRALHLGPGAVPRSQGADLRPAGGRLPHRHHPRRPPGEEAGHRPLRHRPRRRSLREEQGRLRLRGAGVAVGGGEGREPQRVPRLQQAGGPRVVGRAVQDPARRRRGRHLERHERARDLQDADRHHAAGRRARQRGPADRRTARSTTSTAC